MNNNVICLNCGKENKINDNNIMQDENGTYITCIYCGATFDVNRD